MAKSLIDEPVRKATGIPKGYEKGDTSYKLTAETHFYKAFPVAKVSKASKIKATKPSPLDVRVTNLPKSMK